jgi:Ubiquitin carboxyl-terminal hydrolase
VANTSSSSSSSNTAPVSSVVDLSVITDPVQRAIALSAQQRKQQEQAQLKQVMALSRAMSQSGGGGGTHIGNGMNDEERQLALAAEMSLQSAQGHTAALQQITQNPTMRVRQEGVPAGLRNVGNTCYLNSMLQTYYMFPPLRTAILSFPAALLEHCEDTQQKDVLRFMQELQLLFGRLLLSNQKYVDPTAFTNSLVLDGERVKLGNQEDVSGRHTYTHVYVVRERERVCKHSVCVCVCVCVCVYACESTCV